LMPCLTHAIPVRAGTTLREIADDVVMDDDMCGCSCSGLNSKNVFMTIGTDAKHAAVAPAQNARGHAL
jgi:hypothetical protein